MFGRCSGGLRVWWGFLNLGKEGGVVGSAMQPGRDGAALLRVYDATGNGVVGAQLTMGGEIASVSEVNLMEDPIAAVKPLGVSLLTLNLSPFQIKTLRLTWARRAALPAQ